MGLDGVEIVLAVEDAFGVQITDDDAVRMVTPAHVVEFVMTRVPVTTNAACLSQRAFHLVRSSVLGMTPHQRRSVAPHTPLAHLFILTPPQQLADQLVKKMKLPRRPPLDRLSTVGDLVSWLAKLSPLVVKSGEAWTRDEIASVVKQIVVEQLGLREDEYGEDKRFVEDLGVN